MKPPPPFSAQRFCFQYVNADDAKRSIVAVLQHLKWEFQFYPHLSTWIAHKMHPQGDRGTVSLRVQLYTWPTQLHQEGGLVEVLRRYGERKIFDEAFWALRTRCSVPMLACNHSSSL